MRTVRHVASSRRACPVCSLSSSRRWRRPRRRGRPRRVRTTRSAGGTSVLHYRFGPLHIAPGQNTIEFAPTRPQAEGPGLHHALQAPNIVRGRRHDPAGRRHPPAPRRVARRCDTGAKPQRGGARRRRRQRCPRATAGATHDGPVADQPHDPRPHVEPGQRSTSVWTLYFIPDSARGREGMHARGHAVDGRPGHQALPGLQRAQGPGKNGRFTYPDQRPRTRPDGSVRAQPVDRRPRPRRSSPPPATCTRAGCSTDLNVTRDGLTSAHLPLDARTTSSRRARSRGTSRCRRRRRTGGSRVKKGDVLSSARHLRHVERLVVRGHGDHGRRRSTDGPRRRRRPVHGQRSTRRTTSRTAACGEHDTARARRNPGLATRSDAAPTARTRTRSSSRTSSTARATSATTARPARRPSCSRASR